MKETKLDYFYKLKVKHCETVKLNRSDNDLKMYFIYKVNVQSKNY